MAGTKVKDLGLISGGNVRDACGDWPNVFVIGPKLKKVGRTGGTEAEIARLFPCVAIGSTIVGGAVNGTRGLNSRR